MPGMAHPHFILLSSSSSATNAPTLGHPIIHYHYADDPPLALLPRQPTLVMDYDPDTTQPPSVKSLDANIVVTNVKVAPAPGAPASEPSVNPHMFIIETLASDMASATRDDDEPDLNNTIARFRERNTILRKALDVDTQTPPTAAAIDQTARTTSPTPTAQ